MTVKQYATIHNTSVQNVYKHIKNGSLEAQTIENVKYIIIKDEIDYEKKFNDLQHKYDILINKLEHKEEIIDILKDERTAVNRLIEYKQTIEQVTTKKKKKKKKKKS